MPTDDVGAVVEAARKPRRHRRRDVRAVGRVVGPGAAAAGLRRQAIRDADARARGVVMLIDEVITGFRWSSGGAQKRAWASRPTSASWPRSWPAACRAAPSPASATSSTRSTPRPPAAKKRDKIAHPGTYNANPLSAAAAVTALVAGARRGPVPRRPTARRPSCATALRQDPGRGERAVGHLRRVLDLPDLSQPDRRGRSIPRPSIR